MSEELQTLKRIEDLLGTLVKLGLSDHLSNLLKDPGHKMVYENTGRLTVKELSKRTGFSVGKISGLWSQWEKAGLLMKEGKTYRRILR
jgi:hypothetical protein